ncbi:MAG TPA: CoA transferase, partial [Gemmata sp.]|nr:CoA transferase [Gemmata sp.]
GMKLTVRDPAGNPVDLVGNPIHLLGSVQGAATMPPGLGGQTDEVLRGLGLKDAEIAALRAKGIV